MLALGPGVGQLIADQIQTELADAHALEQVQTALRLVQFTRADAALYGIGCRRDQFQQGLPCRDIVRILAQRLQVVLDRIVARGASTRCSLRALRAASIGSSDGLASLVRVAVVVLARSVEVGDTESGALPVYSHQAPRTSSALTATAGKATFSKVCAKGAEGSVSRWGITWLSAKRQSKMPESHVGAIAGK